MNSRAPYPKNDPRELTAWCLYDWAHSVYSLVLATAIFPIYFLAVVPDRVALPWGGSLDNVTLRSLATSVAFLLIAVLAPLLGGISDTRGWKKRFLAVACLLGSACCVGLYWFTSDTLWLGTALFVGATLGYALGETFYNSFLPDIATPDRYDRVSARGFSLGYVGSVLQLVAALVLVEQHTWFGLAEGQAIRLSFVFTGVWWALFGWYVLSVLRQRPPVEHQRGTGSLLTRGFRELWDCTRTLMRVPVLWRFLATFLLYNMAIQTVMYVATDFGVKELHLETGALIQILLIIQLVAIPGAYFFAWYSRTWGNIRALILLMVIWIGICTAAYFTRSALQFNILALVVGLVMGGVQSTSRATYTKLLPADHAGNAAMFGFYNVLDKIAIVLGTATFGVANELLGSMRPSILFLITWLVLALVALVWVPWRKLTAGYMLESRI